MKGSKTWLVWAALAICAATILAAMTWQTRNASAAEQERGNAENRALLQERMRLALWRMDSLGATLVVQEIDPSLVKFSVEWQENGRLTLPGGQPAPVELQRAVTHPDWPFEKIYRTLDHGADRWKAAPAPAPGEAKSAPRASQKGQQIASNTELQKRSEALDNLFSRSRSASKESDRATEAPAADHASGPPMEAAADPSPATTLPRPIWIGPELFLLTPSRAPLRTISGSWIDLGALRNRLLGEIHDLLPAARLVPATAPSDDGLVLASFPLRLEPGPIPLQPDDLLTPAGLSIAAGWAAALIAILAASLLVFGVMRLSERRASFVSAVTHELRTPLTTFRLYSDMLESGAVRPEKRGDYLRVLSREADRLAHLVENVLAFSRIERGSARSAVSTARIADLLEPMRERFEARLASAAMILRMDLANPEASQTVHADAAAIEHILFNLVDNAAKYAVGSHPPELVISIGRRRGFLEIRVTDYGPGIPASEHRRIFRAFHKSARDAAESRPGVGLGLALSRRLAREPGGDLTCEPSPETPGARFILTLPIGRAD